MSTSLMLVRFACLNPCYVGRWTSTFKLEETIIGSYPRLNPCYVGRWTSTLGLMNPLYGAKLRLNPCYVGRWTSTLMNLLVSFFVKMDLILVMLDGGLVLVIIRLY